MEWFHPAESRLLAIQEFRQSGGVPFFRTPLVFSRSSGFLDFPGELEVGCSMVPMYHQPKTHTFVYRLHHKGRTVVLKVYRVGTDRPRPREGRLPQCDVEIRYLRLLAQLVLRGVTPHVTLPIGRTFLRDPSLLVPTPPPGAYHAILSEFADTSLSKLVQTQRLSGYAAKCVLFQVVYTLAVVQDVLPSFRHNDLHASNVLVQALEPPPAAYLTRYRLAGVTSYHNLRECPWRAMLWDMYFSNIDAPGEQSLRGARGRHPYYDLHKLFDSLEYLLRRTPPAYQAQLSDLGALIDTVVPPQYRCMSRDLTSAQ